MDTEFTASGTHGQPGSPLAYSIEAVSQRTKNSSDDVVARAVIRQHISGSRAERLIGFLGAFFVVVGTSLACLLWKLSLLINSPAQSHPLTFNTAQSSASSVSTPDSLVLAITLTLAATAVLLLAASWIGGVMICAQGRCLRAALTTAVNTTPFLTQDEKRKALGLS